jgi:hypothetical protein
VRRANRLFVLTQDKLQPNRLACDYLSVSKPADHRRATLLRVLSVRIRLLRLIIVWTRRSGPLSFIVRRRMRAAETPEISLADLIAWFRRTRKEAERVSIFQPIKCYMGVNRIERQMASMESAYERYIIMYSNHLRNDPIFLGMHPSMVAQQNIQELGNILSGIVTLESPWQLLGATRERKAACRLAVFALYIAIPSFIATLLSLFR